MGTIQLKPSNPYLQTSEDQHICNRELPLAHIFVLHYGFILQRYLSSSYQIGYQIAVEPKIVATYVGIGSVAMGGSMCQSS